jgi:iron complex outermembrane receptor protein
VASGLLTANSTLSYRSLTHQFETASPFLDQPRYALLDAGITYAFGADRRYSVGVYGRNLTDKRYKTSGYQYIASTIAGVPIRNAAGGYTPTLGKEGIATAFYGNPRQVFASIAAKF